jgi:hypothetical protein
LTAAKQKKMGILELGTAGACTDQVAELLVRQHTLRTVHSTARHLHCTPPAALL